MSEGVWPLLLYPLVQFIHSPLPTPPVQWTFNHFLEIGRAWTEGRTILTPCPITLSQSLLYSLVFKLLPLWGRKCKFVSTQAELRFEVGSPNYWMNATRADWGCQRHAQRISITLDPAGEPSISKFEILTGLRCKTDAELLSSVKAGDILGM